jgi:hypothetical protein
MNDLINGLETVLIESTILEGSNEQETKTKAVKSDQAEAATKS